MSLEGWDKEVSPYHSGERDLHDRLGRKEHQDRVARNIHRPFMPEQHRDFFVQLPFIVSGSIDAKGQPWASILFGDPGFLHTPTDRKMAIDAGHIIGDPFFDNVGPDAPVGFVGIELATRRRNRMNGVVADTSDAITVSVVQSYGNCPQYIHTRDLSRYRDPQAAFEPEKATFTDLPEDVAALIARSDVFFVASHNPKDDVLTNGGVDASHRGGKPGFVKVEGNTLTVPDFIGNFAFNTLGNFHVNPKAGLLFIDATTGDLVQLTGTVDLLWDNAEDTGAFRGAERAWRFHLSEGHVLKAAAPYRWQGGEMSPNSALTGDWAEATKTLDARENAAKWHDVKVEKVVDESSVIKSFHLVPVDGSGIVTFEPGQFLTLQVTPEVETAPVTRTYTVSSAPTDGYYRISVKREGLVSKHLHDTLIEGSVIKIRTPKGGFWLDTKEERPAVLLAAGVGITPMMSMVRQAVADGFAQRGMRPITLIHAAQDTKQRAFASELSALQHSAQGALRYISVIDKPAPGEEQGKHYHAEGRATPELLQALLPLADYDFYLCGPPPFMQALYDTLIALGVADNRIMAEAFGPASLTRVAVAAQEKAPSDEAEEAVVTFAASQVEQGWKRGDGTLLESAEAHGLTPTFGCRSGSCGSCATRLLSGKVAYEAAPTFEPKDGEVLICCARPGVSDDPLKLEI